jgi:hypothetical protein
MSETTQPTLVEGAASAAKTYEARAYAASGPSSGLAPAAIRRRPAAAGRATVLGGAVDVWAACHIDGLNSTT